MSVRPSESKRPASNEIKQVAKSVDDELTGKGPVPIWPSFIALVIVGVLFSLLSEQLTIGPSWLILLVVCALLIPFILMWSRRNHRVSKIIGRAMTGLLTLVLAAGVVLLVTSLPTHAIPGPALLRDAAILWVCNVIIFGLWYWEIDGGGPGERHLKGYKPTDFLFPQILAGEPFNKNWSPGLIDFLYLAFNTNTAFSPTDTSVLSRRAKVLMMIQSVMALVVIAVLGARAINILPSGG